MKLIPHMIFIMLCCQLGVAQITNKDVVAKFKIKQLDDSYTIISTATNTTEVYKSLKYSLLIVQTAKNTGEVTKTNQEERFTLEANETKELGITTVDKEEKDKIVIVLLIYEEDEIIGKDRIAINEKKEKPKQEEEQNDGIELKGIVIEETKTKPGRDFYEAFYNAYTFSNINGNKIVGVYETLSFGRSTIIQVKIEDVLIQEFIGKPDQEYLTQMANVTLRKVYKYFKDLKKQEKHIKQY
ncbi:CsgE family curli-type amyloid fiber assembly protein [Aquimarina rhabdastrellae]